LGLRAKEYMNRGELVPDEVVIDIMLDRIMSIHSDEGFILDGFPRNTRQAQELETALTVRARNVNRVLHIDVSEDELARRLGGRYVCRECQAPYTHQSDGSPPACDRCNGELYQRDDDRPEAVQKRIDVYRDETMPVLDFYRKRELYQRDDDRPEAVQKRIDVYRDETMPVLDFYRKRGLLVDIQGRDTVAGVFQHIVEAL
jgi:adenylate kinase